MRPKVYLAGPISGLSFKGATDWRNYAVKRLAARGIEGLSPMRAKEYLAEIEKISGHGREYAHLGPFSLPQGVNCRDRWDCTRSDIVLMNLLGAQKVSIGSMIEVGWTDLARVPLVLVMEKTGNFHDHMMLTHNAGFWVGSLDEAIDICIGLLHTPGGE